MGDKALFSRGNLFFLFVAALLAGAIAKKVTNNHVRIGYDDPTAVIEQGELLNIDDLEQELIRKGLPEEDFSEQGNK